MSETALRTDFNFSTATVSLCCSLAHVCVHLTVDEVCMSELVIKLRGTPVGI